MPWQAGSPGGTRGKNQPAVQGCERPRFEPRVGKIPWRREWQPTPVLLPGEPHGQRSLAGCSPRGRRVRHDRAPSPQQVLCSRSGGAFVLVCPSGRGRARRQAGAARLRAGAAVSGPQRGLSPPHSRKEHQSVQREAERHVRGRGGKRRAERAGRARREGGVPPRLAGGVRGCHVLSADALSPRLRLQVSVFYRTSPKHKLKIIKVSRVPRLVPRGTAREGGGSAHGWPSGGPRAAAPASGERTGGAPCRVHQGQGVGTGWCKGRNAEASLA